MSRRTKVYTGEKTAIANTYAKASNQMDLGEGVECHRVEVRAKSDQASGAWGYLVPSKTELADADANTALGAVAQRVRFFAGPSGGDAAVLDVTFDASFRFLYFLSAAGTINASVIAEKA